MEDKINTFIKAVEEARNEVNAIKINSVDAQEKIESSFQTLQELAQKYHSVINSQHSASEFNNEISQLYLIVNKRSKGSLVTAQGSIASLHGAMITVAEKKSKE